VTLASSKYRPNWCLATINNFYIFKPFYKSMFIMKSMDNIYELFNGQA